MCVVAVSLDKHQYTIEQHTERERELQHSHAHHNLFTFQQWV